MPDLKRIIRQRKRGSSFEIGTLLRQARVESGLTQEELARKLKTRKSAISRIENHAENLRLSTIEKFAQAIGKRISLCLKRA